MADALKNLYDKRFLEALARALSQQYPAFDTDGFCEKFKPAEWEMLELKQRVRFLTQVLCETLPEDYATTLEILKPVSSQFKGFEYMVFPDYVATFGLEEFDLSMDALAVFTVYSTSEFAVRPFIEKYGNKMLQQMLEWSHSDDLHLRRLASEGCRPRLPWATALPEFKKDPSAILPILENLKQDESDYVRRSVANNLNDISRDHPELVKQVARQWLGKNVDTDRLLKHACRTLLKAGDADVLELFGYVYAEHVRMHDMRVSRRVKTGEELVFSFQLESRNEQNLGRLRIEYAIGFYRPGRMPGRKVFKLGEAEYNCRSKSFVRQHSFRTITTRRYYPGEHSLELIINGRVFSKHNFGLVN